MNEKQIKSLQEREMKTFEERMEFYRKCGAHLLIPTPNISEIPPLHTVAYEELFLSSNPEDKDVYKGSSKKEGNVWINKFRISGLALNKLAVCANIVWHTELTKVITLERDYVACQAVGGIRKIDGSIPYEKKSADIDLRILEEKFEDQYNDEAAMNKWLGYNKNKTPDDYRAYSANCVRRDMQQKKQFKLQLAESGAKNRVIRHVLPLKSEYTEQELTQPFVAIRFVYTPDYSDPQVNKMMLLKHMGASADIFGAVPTAIPEKTPSPSPEDHNGEPPVDTEYKEVTDDQTSKQDQIAILCEEFEDMERTDRILRVKELFEEINYTPEKGKLPANKWKDVHLQTFFAANIAKTL